MKSYDFLDTTSYETFIDYCERYGYTIVERDVVLKIVRVANNDKELRIAYELIDGGFDLGMVRQYMRENRIVSRDDGDGMFGNI